jgi:hypothetical protein
VGGNRFSDMQVFDQAWVLQDARRKALRSGAILLPLNLMNTLENSRSVRALEMYMLMELKQWAARVVLTHKDVLKHLVCPINHFELYPRLKSNRRFRKIKFSSDKEMLLTAKQTVRSDIVNQVLITSNTLREDLVNAELLKQRIKKSNDSLKELSIEDRVTILKMNQKKLCAQT